MIVAGLIAYGFALLCLTFEVRRRNRRETFERWIAEQRADRSNVRTLPTIDVPLPPGPLTKYPPDDWFRGRGWSA